MGEQTGGSGVGLSLISLLIFSETTGLISYVDSLVWCNKNVFKCSWLCWNQICMDITLGHDEDLIRFS